MMVSDAWQTPSRLAGLHSAQEHNLRVYATEVISQAGKLLELPQVTVSTAQTLLHRFYFVKSMQKYDVKDIVLGVVFLASKLEENHVDPRSIVNVLNHIYQKVAWCP